MVLWTGYSGRDVSGLTVFRPRSTAFFADGTMQLLLISLSAKILNPRNCDPADLENPRAVKGYLSVAESMGLTSTMHCDVIGLTYWVK